MKKINLPDVIDTMYLDLLAENNRLHETSYPYLCNELEEIKKAYTHYASCQGNPWSIVKPPISPELEKGLKAHYNAPPVSLDYIERLRESSPDVCPMCGGFYPSTLDHFLPKSEYKAWAIYSGNLVPACDCNSKRGTALCGEFSTQERVLHPYFDDILAERQLTCCIDIEKLTAGLGYVNPTHPCIASIKFHVKNIVLKSGVNLWLRSQLSKLYERPSNVIHTLPRKRTVSTDYVVDALEDSLERNDENYGTPNNWTSIFMHGLLSCMDTPVWITHRHNQTLVT